VKTAYHAAAAAATATVTFVKRHAATITSIVVGVAVFAGCEAVTAGVGSIGCAALAGAASSMASYAVTAAQTGHFSVTRFLMAGATGALIGAATAGIFEGVGGIAGGLLGSGAEAGAEGMAEGAVNEAADQGSEEAAETAGKDAGESGEDGPSCRVGGQSFTAKTKVLLADGKKQAISTLKTGQKVLATDTKTGKNKAETITAILVHDDDDLYDLKVRVDGRTAVIDTTSNHLFWAPDSHRWIKAAALKYGTHLRTPSGGPAVALGGYAPSNRSGWMWDLTITPSHDFYVLPFYSLPDTNGDIVPNDGDASVLVHNCDGQIDYASTELGRAAYSARVAAGVGAGRNVAAASVEGLDDPVIGFSQGSGFHAEDDILDQLAEQGIDPERITSLYSEREPCPVCKPLLREVLRPGTPTSWSVPWGSNPIINAASNDLLARMIADAAG
jgi:Xanthomonas XOO_2897-like deaminase/Pretoxin HINT domain